MIKHSTSAAKAARMFALGESTFRTYRKSNGLAMFTPGKTPKLYAPTIKATLSQSARAVALALSTHPGAVINARKWLKEKQDVRYSA